MYLGLLGGAERGSRPSQGDLNLSCERVRAAHHAPRNPCRVFERCHGLTEVVERGAAVQERPPVIPPHFLPSSTALADASIDIMYGVHGLHCMNSIADVLAELLRILRPGGKLLWGCMSDGDSRVAEGAMRAAGFVDVKVDTTRLHGSARWTPVVGVKAS